ncbi:DUF4124 domain-containing protein [Peristeroidobacter soli]|uniref:DUF4124 domain-containing protein n=1 Tax=Peristeroidobacter soli TaxID=2497877 RepID=UPI00101B7229|nr:DUF4124 domain-containing protein [Peristeroidobacter soli]
MRVAAIVFGLSLLTKAVGASAAIYRCAGENGPVYSDQPCGAHANRHEIDDSRVTVYTPPPAEKGRAVPATPAKPAKNKRARAARPPDPARHEAACAKLAQALRDVRTKMRTGYGAKEGERLKERRRQLEERRRIEKCG